ncbi:MAG TPA: DUF1259 domain-containing protein [Woeseiaceae bacterium]
MLTARLFRIVYLPYVMLCASASVSSAEGTFLDIEAISRAAGTEVTTTADGVVRVGWSRDDVPVTIDGVAFPPAAGLGCWAAFKILPGGKVMVMGDTVVFEDEITPAMDAAFAHGLEITALHNHFVFDRPPAYFMHIGGHADDPAVLAKGVRSMWNAIKRVRAERKMPLNRSSNRQPEITGIYDLPVLDSILGEKGEVNGQVLKFTFGHTGRMHGGEFGASMGLSTWAAFSGNANHAVVDGDFAMTANEVQPVMHALRAAGIHIVALHNHMIGEEPPYYFLHYWGNGDTIDLARGLRSALDVTR